ncbi:MAG: hypothetical protein ACI8SR_000806 [Oceanicoccus sp.]|jgi:hypothetical protein
MNGSIGNIENKVIELEKILHQLYKPVIDIKEFEDFLSLYFVSLRNIFFSIRKLSRKDEFYEWYKKSIVEVEKINSFEFFMAIKGEHVLVENGVLYNELEKIVLSIPTELNTLHSSNIDIANECKQLFLVLLSVILDCYRMLGPIVDSQQYFTKEYFASINKTIDDAEYEVYGYIRESYIEEGFDADDRWLELRAEVKECSINHLFYSYLKKVTPQPIISESHMDAEYSPDDKGWVHPVAGVSLK